MLALLSMLEAPTKLAHIPTARKSTRSLTGSLTDTDGTLGLVRLERSSSSSVNWPVQESLRLADDLVLATAPSVVIFLRFERNIFLFLRYQDAVGVLSFGVVTRKSALTITGGHSFCPSPLAKD
jgi:hypothetical protein